MTFNQELLHKIEENLFEENFLDLSNQELTYQDIEALAAALEKNNFIQELDLSFNNLQDESIVLFKSFQNIERLILTYNNFTHEGAKLIAQLPLALKELDISGNIIGDEGAEYLAQMNTLKILIANDCGIATPGAIHLARNKQLQSLYLGVNSIKDEATKEFALNNTLLKLDLSHNYLTSEAAKNLATSKVLVFLNLSHNDIKDEGAAFFSNNQSIVELLLSACKLGDKAAFFLAQNKTIKKLTLSFNNITSNGARYLAKSSTLESITMYNNQLDKSVSDVFLENPNHQLLELNVEGNDLSEETLAQIQRITFFNQEALSEKQLDSKNKIVP